jgi:type I restriction enzyme S subunit
LLNISDEDYFSINIPFPSIEEQRRIAHVLGALNHELDLLAALRGQIEARKRALLSRLLSGELSLPAS